MKYLLILLLLSGCSGQTSHIDFYINWTEILKAIGYIAGTIATMIVWFTWRMK